MRKNAWLWLGLASIGLGFGLLKWRESMVLAPLLLVAGYCVLVPLHLWACYRRGVGE
jgi:hypothetical protein